MKRKALSLALIVVLATAAAAETPPSITEFAPTTTGRLSNITAGPDGNLWFTEIDGNHIGRITPSGSITSFAVQTAASLPWRICAGPDGNLWFTEAEGFKIGQITPTGTVTEFPVPQIPGEITAGADGNLWFVEQAVGKIGRITPTGTVTEFPADILLQQIAAGPDGNLWFTGPIGKIGRITPAGTVSEFPISDAAVGITAGPDGNLWFTEPIGKIGRITPAGTVSEFPVSGSGAGGITAGPDGNLWFTEYFDNKIGRITPTGTVTEFAVPTNLANPYSITVGPDGNVWFASPNSPTAAIGRVQLQAGANLVGDGPFSVGIFGLPGPTGGTAFQSLATDVFGTAVNLGGSVNFDGGPSSYANIDLGQLSTSGSVPYSWRGLGSGCGSCDATCNNCGPSCTLCFLESGTATAPCGPSGCLYAGAQFKGDVSKVAGTLVAGLPPACGVGQTTGCLHYTTYAHGTYTFSAFGGGFVGTAALNAFPPANTALSGASTTPSLPVTFTNTVTGQTITGTATITYDNIVGGHCSTDPTLACTRDANCSGGRCDARTGVTPVLASSLVPPAHFTFDSRQCTKRSKICQTDADCLPVTTYGTCDKVFQAFAFDVASSADFTGMATVCLDYTEINDTKHTGSLLQGAQINENSLALLHLDPSTGQLVDVTTSQDTTNNVICGKVSSFSPFVAGANTNIFGGGRTATDCMSEFNAGPQVTFDARGLPKNAVTCKDGDSCDADATADGQCTFAIDICPNQSDSRLPTCTPTNVSSYTLVHPLPDARDTTDAANAAAILAGVEGLGANTVNSLHHNVVAFGAPVTDTTCTTGIHVTVPLRNGRNGTKLSGTKTITLKATDASNVADTDTLILVCQP